MNKTTHYGRALPRAKDRAGANRPQEGVALIEALYTLGDINAEIHGKRALIRSPLDSVDDIGLVDDVIDALLDPDQARHARPVLREALAVIARRALEGRTA